MTIAKEGGTTKVLAPSDLPGGYVLDVTLEGRTFAVAVPPGGVREGEYFNGIVTSPLAMASAPPAEPEITIPIVSAVPNTVAGGITTTKTSVPNVDGTQTVTERTTYPDGRVVTSVTTVPAGRAGLAAKPAATPQRDSAAADVPTGAWRHGLCDCCDACGSGTFWMSFCCLYVALGQLLQRLKLNSCGQPGNYENTCVTWTVVWMLACGLYGIIVVATQGYGVVIYYCLAYLAIVALTQARYYMRTKWSIPADCCEGSGCLSDCCCVYWCTCCSVIQMLRHTHDEKVHRYSCSSKTGLDDGAPEVV